MDLLLLRRIDGLITQHKFSSPDYGYQLEQKGIPMVRLVSAQTGFACDLVRCDTWQAAYDLVHHLIGLGHRRIAALGPQLPSAMGSERIEGYRQALTDAGLPVSEDLEVMEGWRTRDGYNMTHRLLERTKPDALFAFGPRIAVGAVTAIHERGLRIPEDVGLVCIDDFGMGSDLNPFMTVARQPEVEMGRRAAQLLFDRMSEKYEGTPREVVFQAQLIVRRSCGASSLEEVNAIGKHAWEDDDQG